MVEYHEKELKEKLLKVYRKFVEDPSNLENIEEIKLLDGEYASLAAANDYIASQPVLKSIQDGVGFLSTIWAYSFGMTQEELT